MNPASLKGRGGLNVSGQAVPLEFGEKFGHADDNAALMLSTQEHSCGVRQMVLPAHILAMGTGDSQSAQTAAEIRQWMLDAMKASGMSARAWAREAGVAASTIQRAIKPDYEFVTSSRTLAKLAKVAGVDPPNVTKTTTLPHSVQILKVRYLVQAGTWVEADNQAQDYLGEYPVAPDPRFAQHPQWLEQVVGDSVNQLIPDGAYAHVIDAFGYSPKTGDVVVVERLRAGGHLRERTIKQVQVTDDGAVELWPRSSNPKWSKPVVMVDGCEPGEDVQVQIVGLVISYTMPLRTA